MIFKVHESDLLGRSIGEQEHWPYCEQLLTVVRMSFCMAYDSHDFYILVD